MAAKRKITEVEEFISIRTVVRTLCDKCPTNEDAVPFIKEGLVKINGEVITDPFYGVNGFFLVSINGQEEPCGFHSTFHSTYNKITQKQLLRFANKKVNLQRLRNGEVLTFEETDKEGDLKAFHVSLSPPDFMGSRLIACYYGWTCKSPGAIGGDCQAITECGTRI